LRKYKRAGRGRRWPDVLERRTQACAPRTGHTWITCNCTGATAWSNGRIIQTRHQGRSKRGEGIPSISGSPPIWVGVTGEKGQEEGEACWRTLGSRAAEPTCVPGREKILKQRAKDLTKLKEGGKEDKGKTRFFFPNLWEYHDDPHNENVEIRSGFWSVQNRMSREKGVVYVFRFCQTELPAGRRRHLPDTTAQRRWRRENL